MEHFDQDTELFIKDGIWIDEMGLTFTHEMLQYTNPFDGIDLFHAQSFSYIGA